MLAAGPAPGEAPGIAAKRAAMAASDFGFFRGDLAGWARDAARNASGKELDELQQGAWLVCGDAHAGNFGAWTDWEGKGAYGPNDFDEAFYGPAWWDILRFCSSLFAHFGEAAESAAHAAAASFASALARGRGCGAKLCRGACAMAKEASEQRWDAFAAQRSRSSAAGYVLEQDRKSRPAAPEGGDWNLARACVKRLYGAELADAHYRECGLASLGTGRMRLLAVLGDGRRALVDLKPLGRNPILEAAGCRDASGKTQGELSVLAARLHQALPCAGLACAPWGEQGEALCKFVCAGALRTEPGWLCGKDWKAAAKMFGELLALGLLRQAAGMGAGEFPVSPEPEALVCRARILACGNAGRRRRWLEGGFEG